MRILHCTDFHGNERWYEWLVLQAQNYDLICLTGDLLNLLEFERIEAQLHLIESLLGRISVPVALCSGNNDSFAEHPRLFQAAWLKSLRRPGLWVDGDAFALEGQRFRSIGWNALLPAAEGDEVWLFHGPPAMSPLGLSRFDGSDSGDQILGERCRASKGPAVVLSGHQHNPVCWTCKVGRTRCFNPGVNESSAVSNYVVIDTVDRVASMCVDDDERSRVGI